MARPLIIRWSSLFILFPSPLSQKYLVPEVIRKPVQAGVPSLYWGC